MGKNTSKHFAHYTQRLFVYMVKTKNIIDKNIHIYIYIQVNGKLNQLTTAKTIRQAKGHQETKTTA